MSFIIGVDLGTHSIRTCVFREDGKKIAYETVPFTSTRFPEPNYAEQDPNEWWEAFLSTLNMIKSHTNFDVTDILAISIVSTSCTMVVLDSDGNPLRPAILWMDQRAIKEAEEITKTNNPVLKYSGGKVSPEWMLPKIKWLMNNEPDIFDQSFRIVEQSDFINYKLTGKWSLSYNNLVAKWNYANPVGGWPDGFLHSVGLSKIFTKIPYKKLPVGTPIGTISRRVSKLTGLPNSVMVIQGGIDSHAGMVGLSALHSGDLGITLGTSTVVMGYSNSPIYADIHGPYPDAIYPGSFSFGGGLASSGSGIDWLVSIISENNVHSSSDFLKKLESDAMSIPPGSDGLVTLNYLKGNRTPLKDSYARGSIWGLSLRHTPGHLLRSFYESNAYAVRHIIENLLVNGFSLNNIFAGGGFSRSPLVMQILVDVCGLPIHTIEESENTALGAAIWAGLGSGLFTNYDQAVESMVKPGISYFPDPNNKHVYDFYYEMYRQTYNRLSELMHKVVTFEMRRDKIS